MRKTATVILGASALVLLGSLVGAPSVHAAGQVPSGKVCKDKDNPPTDVVTKGGCVVANRRKGNCMGCHLMAGVSSGNIAPPLAGMKQRFPDKAKLRAQIWDASKFKADTVMPPFGRHGILSEEEIDQVGEFILTL